VFYIIQDRFNRVKYPAKNKYLRRAKILYKIQLGQFLFLDPKFVYLLTDAYLGGDLWRTLVTKGPFKDGIARFYIACVVEAFDYLHSRMYCYR